VVYFHGRPAHTFSLWSIFKGDLPSHSQWSIFTGNLPTHVHLGLLSGATGPHVDTVYFHGRLALTLRLIYFHERPTHTFLSWSIFKGDRPTHSHGLFSWATCPHMFIVVYFQGRSTHTLTRSIFMGDLSLHSHWSIFTGDLPTHVHFGLFSRATCPHMFTLVYFQGRPALLIGFT